LARPEIKFCRSGPCNIVNGKSQYYNAIYINPAAWRHQRFYGYKSAKPHKRKKVNTYMNSPPPETPDPLVDQILQLSGLLARAKWQITISFHPPHNPPFKAFNGTLCSISSHSAPDAYHTPPPETCPAIEHTGSNEGTDKVTTSPPGNPTSELPLATNTMKRTTPDDVKDKDQISPKRPHKEPSKRTDPLNPCPEKPARRLPAIYPQFTNLKL
jgi:hypothetical protein